MLGLALRLQGEGAERVGVEPAARPGPSGRRSRRARSPRRRTAQRPAAVAALDQDAVRPLVERRRRTAVARRSKPAAVLEVVDLLAVEPDGQRVVRADGHLRVAASTWLVDLGVAEGGHVVAVPSRAGRGRSAPWSSTGLAAPPGRPACRRCRRSVAVEVDRLARARPAAWSSIGNGPRTLPVGHGLDDGDRSCRSSGTTSAAAPCGSASWSRTGAAWSRIVAERVGRGLAEVGALVGQAAEVDLARPSRSGIAASARVASNRVSSAFGAPRAARGSPRGRRASPRAVIAALRTVERGSSSRPAKGSVDPFELADLAEGLGGGHADGRRRALERAWPVTRPPAFALNRPSAAITRGWRSAPRSPRSSRSTRALTARSVPIVLDARQRGVADRLGGLAGRGRRRSGAGSASWSSSAPSALAISRRTSRSRAPRRTARGGPGASSRSSVSSHGGDRREPDRDAPGRPGRRGSSRGRSASPPSRSPWPAACRAVGRVPHHLPSQGLALRWTCGQVARAPWPAPSAGRVVGRRTRRAARAASGS